MEPFRDSQKSTKVYDPSFGFHVKKLTPDHSIPRLVKIEGAVWHPVYTVNGQEERLAQMLAQLQIPTYYPRRYVREKKHQGIPFFPGVIFAALSNAARARAEKLLFLTGIMDILDQETEELVFADMVLSNIAEKVSRFFPFSYEKKLPDVEATDEQAIPMKINGYGDCRIIDNARQEKTKIIFNFQTLNTILKFDLTLCQFRSLLLSKVLFF